jgi:hypothetical protein
MYLALASQVSAITGPACRMAAAIRKQGAKAEFMAWKIGD